MKLTKDSISWLENYSEIPDDVLTIDCKHENWEQLRQQILDDYEKARKYDERIRGLPVPEECNIYNGMTLKILLEKARKWDSWPEVREILRNQKLRELVEKKIVNLPGQIKAAPSQSWIDDYVLLLIEFKELIKDSKK